MKEKPTEANGIEVPNNPTGVKDFERFFRERFAAFEHLFKIYNLPKGDYFQLAWNLASRHEPTMRIRGPIKPGRPSRLKFENAFLWLDVQRLILEEGLTKESALKHLKSNRVTYSRALRDDSWVNTFENIKAQFGWEFLRDCAERFFKPEVRKRMLKDERTIRRISPKNL